jgi:hypothetical protein
VERLGLGWRCSCCHRVIPPHGLSIQETMMKIDSPNIAKIRVGRIGFLVVAIISLGFVVCDLSLGAKYKNNELAELKDWLIRVECILDICENVILCVAWYTIKSPLQKISKAGAASAVSALILAEIVMIGGDIAIWLQSVNGPFEQVGGFWMSLTFFYTLSYPLFLFGLLMTAYILWQLHTRSAQILAMVLGCCVILFILRVIDIETQNVLASFLRLAEMIYSIPVVLLMERWLHSEELKLKNK